MLSAPSVHLPPPKAKPLDEKQAFKFQVQTEWHETTAPRIVIFIAVGATKRLTLVSKNSYGIFRHRIQSCTCTRYRRYEAEDQLLRFKTHPTRQEKKFILDQNKALYPGS